MKNQWTCERVPKVVCRVDLFLLDFTVKKKQCPILNPLPLCALKNGTCFTGNVTCEPGLMCCLDNTCEHKCTLPALVDGKNVEVPLFVLGLWGWNCSVIVTLSS